MFENDEELEIYNKKKRSGMARGWGRIIFSELVDWSATIVISLHENTHDFISS